MKTKSVKVSVIVPAHNSENTISRCIESLLNQSLKELEIILVDDNSTDGTYSIMKRYQRTYPSQICVLQTEKPKEMSGPGYARNMGIKVAQGIYIGFVDSDDWVDSNLFYNAYEGACEEEADIAIFGVKNEFSNAVCSRIRYQYEHNSINHVYALHLLCHLQDNDCFISPMVCQKIYRANYLKQYNLYFDTDSLYEDDQFSFFCFLHECRIVLIHGIYYHYFQHSESITHTFSRKHIDTLIKAFTNIREYMQIYSCYNTYQDDYYAYMDKCISSALNMLFCAEPNILLQKKYITYLLKKLSENFTLEEWISYLDIQRIQRFFNITK